MTDTAQLQTLLADNDTGKIDGLLPNQPAVAATTVAVANPYAFPVWVRVTGGTVTVATVDSIAIPFVLASGAGDWIRLRAGSKVALTYSAAPTWQWFQE